MKCKIRLSHLLHIILKSILVLIVVFHIIKYIYKFPIIVFFNCSITFYQYTLIPYLSLISCLTFTLYFSQSILTIEIYFIFASEYLLLFSNL